MPIAHPRAIPLEYLPSPDGDNRLDVDIREGETHVTYFSSSRAKGGARDIRIVFNDCVTVRFVATEDHEKECPGFGDLDSSFAEICDSSWLECFPVYRQSMEQIVTDSSTGSTTFQGFSVYDPPWKHFAFGLNDSFFECIAGGYRVEPCPNEEQR